MTNEQFNERLGALEARIVALEAAHADLTEKYAKIKNTFNRQQRHEKKAEKRARKQAGRLRAPRELPACFKHIEFDAPAPHPFSEDAFNGNF